MSDKIIAFVDPTTGKIDPGLIPDGSGGAALPSGGTTGQVLRKKSATNGDVEWATPASSGGSTAPAGLMHFAWFTSAIAIRDFDPRVLTPPFGTVELLGVSAVARNVASSNGSGNTTIRVYINEVPAGDLSLPALSKSASAHKTGSSAASRIFVDTPVLQPSTQVSIGITSTASGTTPPDGLTVLVWYRYSA